MREAKTGLIPVGISPGVRLVFNEKKTFLDNTSFKGAIHKNFRITKTLRLFTRAIVRIFELVIKLLHDFNFEPMSPGFSLTFLMFL